MCSPKLQKGRKVKGQENPEDSGEVYRVLWKSRIKIHQNGLCIVSPCLSSMVTFLNHSEPQFPHLRENQSSIYRGQALAGKPLGPQHFAADACVGAAVRS